LFIVLTFYFLFYLIGDIVFVDYLINLG